MSDVLAILKVLHLVTAVFMAAPLYALITVNERGGFGRAIHYPLDRYMENLVKKQPRRCYMYLLTLLATGLLIVLLGGWGLGAMVSYWPLAAKGLLLLALVGLLSYVHYGIQPQVESLLEGFSGEGEVSPEAEARIWALRKRRKALATTCLFLVLTTVLMGLRVMTTLSPLLTALLIVLAGMFALRVHRSTIPFGWF